MQVINVMQRRELKFILTKEQLDIVLPYIESNMKKDIYGLTTILSLYYDTPDYLLIRKSIEKPIFKEKIRVRSYGIATNKTKLYLELKRKYNHIVYKRRIGLNQQEIDEFFKYQFNLKDKNQIGKEIDYFRDYYHNLKPACLIIYDRIAYKIDNSDFRITIDYNPRFRLDNLNLNTNDEGKLILPKGSVIIELKVQHAVPLWILEAFRKANVNKDSFSKYGTVYQKYIVKENKYV